MSFITGVAAANVIFWMLLPLVLTIATWTVATRWVDRRFGRGWAIGLGSTVIPLASYFLMFSISHLVGRGLVWLGLG